MKRILTSRLPERLGGALPPVATEFVVGLLATLLFFGLRLFLQPWTGNSAPFALSFLAVVMASLLAGWRSGLVSLTVGQLLGWYYLVPYFSSFRLAGLAELYSLLMATFSELVILLVITLYQREVATSGARRQRQIDFLGQALREIDHRTHNNFHTVLSLITLQANRADSTDVKMALQEAADRIRAVSLAYDKLALSSVGLETVRLDDHLQELCEQISRGIVPDGVSLRTRLAAATIRADAAISLGIIANELVTNAVKHAFKGKDGTIEVATRRDGDALELRVSDNGCGLSASKQRGLGTRLVETFVRQLGGWHEVTSSAGGVTHRILIPVADSAWVDRSAGVDLPPPSRMVEGFQLARTGVRLAGA